MTEVTIYTSLFCGYCHAAKKLLQDKGVVFNEIDVTMDSKGRAAMQERAGSRSVPQIFINGTLVGGCDDLYALETHGELDAMLATESV